MKYISVNSFFRCEIHIMEIEWHSRDIDGMVNNKPNQT